MSYSAISRTVLNEIDSQTKDPVLKELVRVLLQFEMENWQNERAHYKDHYEKEMEFQCRRRLG